MLEYMTLRSSKPKKHGKSAADAPPFSEAPPFTMSPRKVALVAIDWKAACEDHETERPDWESGGFYPLFPRITRICDQAGCDTILYALWSHAEHRHGPLTKRELCGRKPENLRWVILEMNQGKKGVRDPIYVWEPGGKKPHVLFQRMSRGSNPKWEKDAFIDDLQCRIFGSTMLLLCGEIGIIQTIRGSDNINDEYAFLDKLRSNRIKVILNPGHDYMVRPEMPKKRAVLSEHGRWVISVWNRGNKGKDAFEPWQVFYNGREMTQCVNEFKYGHEHDLGPDIRIGVIDLRNAGHD